LSEINIIEANEEDIPEIIELWKELIDYHKDIDLFFKRREDAHLNYESFISELMRSEDTKIFVAKEENIVVGYVLAKIDFYPPVYLYERHGEIYDLIVKSTYRGRGIGSDLLSKAIEWFNSLGLERVEVNLVTQNKVASTFYLKHGFKDYMQKLYLEFEKFKKI